GWQRVCGRTHGGRARPTSAQGTGAVAARCPDPDRARRRLPLLDPVMTHLPTHAREQRLLAQIRHLRRAVDSLPDGVVLLDRHGAVRWANPVAETLLGIHRKRDHGKPMADLLHDSVLGQWLLSDDNAPPADIPAPTDPERHISITLMPFGDDEHVLLARDISHISRLEKMRRDFVANVSHELRTPLTVIHGYLELFDPDDMPALAPALAEMRVQSHRMGQIVEDLLTLSRLETQQHLSDEHVAMDAMLASLAKEAEALSQGRHHISVHNDAD